MKVINLLLSALALDEVIDHAGIQRPRPIQRQHSNDVFKAVGLQLGEQLFHAVRFHLENGGCIGITQHLIGSRVIKAIELTEREVPIGVKAIDVIHGHLNDGEIS